MLVFAAFTVIVLVPLTRYLLVSADVIEVTDVPLTFEPETTVHGFAIVPSV